MSNNSANQRFPKNHDRENRQKPRDSKFIIEDGSMYSLRDSNQTHWNQYHYAMMITATRHRWNSCIEHTKIHLEHTNVKVEHRILDFDFTLGIQTLCHFGSLRPEDWGITRITHKIHPKNAFIAIPTATPPGSPMVALKAN